MPISQYNNYGGLANASDTKGMYRAMEMSKEESDLRAKIKALKKKTRILEEDNASIKSKQVNQG